MAFTERPACPICGHHAARTLYDRSFGREPMTGYLRQVFGAKADDWLAEVAGDTFRLDECGGCRGIFQRFTGDDALLTKLYSDWARTADVQTEQQTHPLKYYLRRTQEVVSVIRYFESLPGADRVKSSPSELNVLDFGMGWGEWCQTARSFGCRTWGYEISKPLQDWARRQALPVIADLDSSRQPFDLINAEQVFEHLVDPLGMLRRLSAHLSPRGIIRVCVPSARRIHANLRRETWTADRHSKQSLNAVAPLEHVNCFAGDSLAAMGRAAGLVPFRIAEGLPIGMKGALKEAVRPILEQFGIQLKNVCYYRRPSGARSRTAHRDAA